MNAKRTSSPFQRFEYCRKTGMLCSWLPHANESVFWTHMFSPDSAPGKRSRVSLVTPRHGSLPWFGAQKISDGKLHDVNILDRIAFEAGSIVVMDRGYIDFARLHALHLAQAFFVTRAKSNLQYRRVYSHPVDKTTGLRCDQTISVVQSRLIVEATTWLAFNYWDLRPARPPAPGARRGSWSAPWGRRRRG